jgi:hypothetical protein
MTTINEAQAKQAVDKLGNDWWMTVELACALSQVITGDENNTRAVNSQTARYWATRLSLPPNAYLERKEITSRLTKYRRTPSIALSSSVTVRKS